MLNDWLKILRYIYMIYIYCKTLKLSHINASYKQKFEIFKILTLINESSDKLAKH